MTRTIVVVLCSLLALSRASIDPRDLADEATEQLNELISIVQGDILAAHNKIDELGTEFNSYTINVYENGALSIQQEQETINSQLTSVKDLAENAGYDVTACTSIREEVLNRLPMTYSEQMAECIADINTEREKILRDAKYIIDIVMTKVRNLERQLDSCRGEIVCISPLVTEIQLEKVRLPMNIAGEVQAAESLVATLKLSVDTCSESNVSSYVADASSILRDITACVDRIIDG